MTELVISRNLTLRASELQWTAVRSGGPGGQNVNKVATKVELRFDPEACAALSDGVRQRLRSAPSVRWDAQGRILVTADETRSQSQNLESARQKLATLLRSALVVPRQRRPTRPTRSSQRARLELKRRIGDKKQQRKSSE
jgi:ribosome-associated protein